MLGAQIALDGQVAFVKKFAHMNMGGSQSTNAASAVAQAVNNVRDSTSANSTQVQTLSQSHIDDNCHYDVGGNFSITQFASDTVKNQQFTTGVSNTGVQNDLAQKLLQSATSTVGSLGIGFSDASNTINMFANAETDIANTISSSVNQYAQITEQNICHNSTYHIGGDFSLAQSIAANSVANNVTKSQYVNNIQNTLDQSSSQTSKATVEGILGALLGILIAVCALSMLIGGKIMILFAVLLVVGVVVIVVMNKSVFFGKDIDCNPLHNASSCKTCSNPNTKTIRVKSPPVRYMYDIYHSSTSARPSNLMNMVVTAYATNPKCNGGYTKATAQQVESAMSRIKSQIKTSVPSLTNVDTILDTLPSLMCVTDTVVPVAYLAPECCQKCTSDHSSNDGFGSRTPQTYVPTTASSCAKTDVPKSTGDSDESVLAVVNTAGYEAYCKNPANAKVARFVLCMMIYAKNSDLSTDLSIFVDDDELVRYYDEDGVTVHIQQAAQAYKENHAVKYIPGDSTQKAGVSAMQGAGTLEGPIGTCHVPGNSFFGTTAGQTTVLGVTCFVFLTLVLLGMRKKSVIDVSHLSQKVDTHNIKH